MQTRDFYFFFRTVILSCSLVFCPRWSNKTKERRAREKLTGRREKEEREKGEEEGKGKKTS